MPVSFRDPGGKQVTPAGVFDVIVARSAPNTVLGKLNAVFREFKAGHMKFVLIGLILLAGSGYGGAKAVIHYQVSDAVETAVMVTAPYASVEYSGISSTLSGELTIDDVRIQVSGYRDEIFIGSVCSCGAHKRIGSGGIHWINTCSAALVRFLNRASFAASRGDDQRYFRC